MEFLYYVLRIAAETTFALKGTDTYQILFYRENPADVKSQASEEGFYFSVCDILSFIHKKI